jgi:methionine salvage enolase-phosphatase E1
MSEKILVCLPATLLLISELISNLKAAKQIGLMIPPVVMLRESDQVK